MAAPVWVKDYLARHDLGSYVSNAINAAVGAKAEDPKAFMARFLAESSSLNGKINKVTAREVVSGNGLPSLRVDVWGNLDGYSRILGTGISASGRNEGEEVPIDLLDQDESRFAGKGCTKACEVVNTIINKKCTGRVAKNSEDLDERLWDESDQRNKSDFGANALHATSLAVARAGAASCHQELWDHVLGRFNEAIKRRKAKSMDGVADTADGVADPAQQVSQTVLDGNEARVPALMATMVQHAVVDGAPFRSVSLIGKHDEDVTKQAFNLAMVASQLKDAFPEAANFTLSPNGCVVECSVADACAAIAKVASDSGLELGSDVSIVIDFGASRLFDAENKMYKLASDDAPKDVDAWLEFIKSSCASINGLAAVIDPAGTVDFETWRKLREAWQCNPRLLGDDLFDSNPHTADQGTMEGWADGIVSCLPLTGNVLRLVDLSVLATSREQCIVVRASVEDACDDSLADLAVGARAWAVNVGNLPSALASQHLSRLSNIQESLSDSKRLAVWVPAEVEAEE